MCPDLISNSFFFSEIFGGCHPFIAHAQLSYMTCGLVEWTVAKANEGGFTAFYWNQTYALDSAI